MLKVRALNFECYFYVPCTIYMLLSELIWTVGGSTAERLKRCRFRGFLVVFARLQVRIIRFGSGFDVWLSL